MSCSLLPRAAPDPHPQAPRAQERPPCSLLIPRIVHFIWLGPSQVPALGRRCIESWRSRHPQWEIRLWRDADAAAFPMTNRRLFAGAKNWGEASDILRYELMARCGGVYADLDVECLRPLDDLLLGVQAFLGFAGPHVENAILGSVPAHPFFTEIVRQLPVRIEKYGRKTDTVALTGPRVLEDACRRYCGYLDLTAREPRELAGVTVFSPSFLYPDKNAPGDAYTLHHWTMTWTKQSRSWGIWRSGVRRP